MGRRPKLYERECEAVREMGPGEALKFKIKHPKGLAKRLYRELDNWMLKSYYDLTIGEDYVIVKKENTAYNFPYD